MTKTPEGFLVCHNVPIARTGWYEYLASEIGTGGNEIVKVYRSPEEVFSQSAIASFEGKPVTDEHPPDLLTPETVNIFVKGTIQNVRQDTKQTDLLIGDLIIYDSVLINEIDKGKREVSCGYECSYKDNGDGTYNQVQICGNHVAVVEAGRAGDRVAIKDSKISDRKGEKKKMAKKKITKSWLQALGLKHYIADADPEEAADALNEISKEGCDDEQPVQTQENKLSNDDGEGNSEMAALNAKMDKLIALLSNGVAPKAEDEEPEKAIDEIINTLENGKETTTGDEEESVTVPADQISSDEDVPSEQKNADESNNPSAINDSSAMLMALKAVRPVIANIPDKAARKKACDSLIAQFKNTANPSQKNSYAAIMKAQRSTAINRKKAADAAEAKMKVIEDSYKKQNPHYKEVK